MLTKEEIVQFKQFLHLATFFYGIFVFFSDFLALMKKLDMCLQSTQMPFAHLSTTILEMLNLTCYTSRPLSLSQGIIQGQL